MPGTGHVGYDLLRSELTWIRSEFSEIDTFQMSSKKESRKDVVTFKEENIRPVMLPDDKSMTCCFIVRVTGILEPDAQVILADIDQIKIEDILVWCDIDNELGFTTEKVRSVLRTLVLRAHRFLLRTPPPLKIEITRSLVVRHFKEEKNQATFAFY